MCTKILHYSRTRPHVRGLGWVHEDNVHIAERKGAMGGQLCQMHLMCHQITVNRTAFWAQIDLLLKG